MPDQNLYPSRVVARWDECKRTTVTRREDERECVRWVGWLMYSLQGEWDVAGGRRRVNGRPVGRGAGYWVEVAGNTAIGRPKEAKTVLWLETRSE